MTIFFKDGWEVPNWAYFYHEPIQYDLGFVDIDCLICSNSTSAQI